jgi:hypothetical protein
MKLKHTVITLLMTALGCGAGFYFGERRGAVPPDPIAPSPEVIAKILGAIDNDYDLSKLDPQTRADATLQMWYAAQHHAASILGSETGHEFRPIWMRRSPITVLEEQSDVMQRWIADRKWGYPPETARDPADGSRIDWEDHLPSDDQSATTVIWLGKHARTGEWMAYEQGKGVYKPTETLMKRIHDHEKTQR